MAEPAKQSNKVETKEISTGTVIKTIDPEGNVIRYEHVRNEATRKAVEGQ